MGIHNITYMFLKMFGGNRTYMITILQEHTQTCMHRPPSPPQHTAPASPSNKKHWHHPVVLTAFVQVVLTPFCWFWWQEAVGFYWWQKVTWNEIWYFLIVIIICCFKNIYTSTTSTNDTSTTLNNNHSAYCGRYIEWTWRSTRCLICASYLINNTHSTKPQNWAWEYQIQTQKQRSK